MPSKPSTSTPQPEAWSYEESVAAIEAIIADLESGRLPLADVLTQFEQAVQTLRQCEAYLTEKRTQVDLLIETLSD
jgi:exodeoxyribonuclease VII small subunit